MNKRRTVWVWLERNRRGHYFKAKLIDPYILSTWCYGEARVQLPNQEPREVAQYRLRMKKPKNLDQQTQRRNDA
jgi:hypothetical protein